MEAVAPIFTLGGRRTCILSTSPAGNILKVALSNSAPESFGRAIFMSTFAFTASVTVSCAGMWVLYNVVSWYKFASAWNSIARVNRMELAIVRRCRRRLTYKALMQSLVHVDTLCQKNTSCPICLTEFFENENVVCCDDGGCGTWFHRQCIAQWLDKSDHCPCCRKDMVTQHKKGWFATAASCVGLKL